MAKPTMYLYETHMHTSEGSACGKSSGAEMAEAYFRAGYSGIVVTDHFFNGNCAVPKDLAWADRVERFCCGYENAAAAGRNLGLSVFFGWEYNYQGTEFLTYGLDKAFLLAHPDLLEWDLLTYLRFVRDAGAFVSQAHPFRRRPYIAYTRLLNEHVDAVEVHNEGNEAEWNEMADHYATLNNLAVTAGSDAHQVTHSPFSGLAFERRLESIADFMTAVRNREGSVIRGHVNPLAEAF